MAHSVHHPRLIDVVSGVGECAALCRVADLLPNCMSVDHGHVQDVHQGRTKHRAQSTRADRRENAIKMTEVMPAAADDPEGECGGAVGMLGQTRSG